MLPSWHHDLESLEKISQDDLARDLVLRMAALEQAGKLGPFLFELAADDEVDKATKDDVVELARDPNFLFAVEDYVQRTEIFH
jgi:hypothetical protein